MQVTLSVDISFRYSSVYFFNDQSKSLDKHYVNISGNLNVEHVPKAKPEVPKKQQGHANSLNSHWSIL